eukprot:TRINITY_DN756_c0_g1_i8.p1 TRINITY_DN756_c0_g1~~TRINITY_DN756_c0_g1_i8.p1  ORF type:complete len:102 (-),score=8.81 TRINITY_DN756_c0_g1_i8:248-553(-)
MLKGLCYVHVKNKNATIRTAIECYTQRSVTNLKKEQITVLTGISLDQQYPKSDELSFPRLCCRSYLKGDKSIVDHHLLGQEVRSNCGFVLITESSIDVLIH